eukprot:529140_1
MNNQHQPFQIDWNDKQKLTNGMMFLYKTRTCPAWKRKKCTYRNNCFDAHDHDGAVKRRRPQLVNFATNIWNYSPDNMCSSKYSPGKFAPCNYSRGKCCPNYHSMTELNYHPLIYKTRSCMDMQYSTTGVCSRGVACSEYHSYEDRRDVSNLFIPSDIKSAGLSEKMPPPQQYLDWCNSLQVQQPQRPLQHQPPHIPNDIIQDEERIPPELVFSNFDIPIHSDIISSDEESATDAEIKIYLQQIVEQMSLQEKQLNEIKQLIMKAPKTAAVAKTRNNNETEKYQILIDGYLRALHEQSNTYFNVDISTLVHWYAKLTDEKKSGKSSEKNNDLWETIKKKHMDVENESVYLMVINAGVDIRNKTFIDIKTAVLELMYRIGIELDEIYKDHNNQFEVQYDKTRAYLYCQLRLMNADAVSEATTKAKTYVNKKGQTQIEKKWKVRQWCNYQNRYNDASTILSKKHKVKSLRNNNQQQNQSQNRYTDTKITLDYAGLQVIFKYDNDQEKIVMKRNTFHVKRENKIVYVTQNKTEIEIECAENCEAKFWGKKLTRFCIR